MIASQSKMHHVWNYPFECIFFMLCASCLGTRTVYRRSFIHSVPNESILNSNLRFLWKILDFKLEGKVLIYETTFLATVDLMLNYHNSLFLSVSYLSYWKLLNPRRAQLKDGIVSKHPQPVFRSSKSISKFFNGTDAVQRFLLHIYVYIITMFLHLSSM